MAQQPPARFWPPYPTIRFLLVLVAFILLLAVVIIDLLNDSSHGHLHTILFDGGILAFVASFLF